MRIIGIDPGSIRTGWGIIDVQNSGINYVDSGIILFEKSKFYSEKLVYLYDSLSEIIGYYKPVEASIENIFYYKNARSALVLGYIRGACILCLKKFGCNSIYQYTPKKIKMSVIGSGLGTKDRIKKMVISILDLKKDVKYEDESDALASAICHANNRRFMPESFIL